MHRLQTIEKLAYELSSKASQEWYIRQCRNVWDQLYLYHKPATETENGQLRICGESDTKKATKEGFGLSSPQRLSPSWTPEQARSFIRETVNRLPILASEA